MNIEQVIEKLQFRFAKTMPQNPHWYTVKNDELKVEYEFLFLYILKNGDYESWWGKEYRYLIIGDYKYWLMTEDISESKIINRRPIR